MSGSFGPSGGSVNLASPVAIGNITPNAVTSTNLTSTGRIVEVPGTVQSLLATTSIACISSIVPISSVANITLTSNPQIATGLNGQKVTLVNTGSFAITLVTGNGLLMPSNIILYGGRQVSFTYLTAYTSWVSDVLIPESVALTGIPTVPTASFNANSTQIASTAQVFNHLYNHDFPGWRNLTLTSNWVDFGAPFPVPSIKRVGRDLVYVRGVVSVSGTYNTLITTIPADCRPSNSLNFAGFTSTGVGQVSLASNGNLTCSSTLTTGQFQIITFSYSL